MSKQPRRPLPQLTDSNRFFWTSGEDGRLRFLRCSDCANLIHPPVPICDRCQSMSQEVTTVSGRATLAAVTVNHQMWMPMIEPPYIIALVEIEEQPGVRLTTNIIDCDESQLYIGMPLEVDFEHYEDVYLPVFRPAAGEVA
ncbi:MAG: OB-fold domain-containing protein [Halioglobus sp.]|nr:OB-fold domain-containing protein [Halioglobus sp.]